MSEIERRREDIRVAVVGLGVMGTQHVQSYRAINSEGIANRLVAICDPSAERREAELFGPGRVATYELPADLFADESVDLVSLCTYTDSHVPLAISALEAGKHVLVEKPVALSGAGVSVLAEAAQRFPEQLCMPAMCMRFWPGWRWLRDRVNDRSLGAVRSAHFHRVAPAPDWARDFYADASRSGGALVDLHVHDSDFVRWCFGSPEAVHTVRDGAGFTTRYIYPDDSLKVTAHGAWDPAPGAVFEMGFRVVFDAGTADYSFGRDPKLQLEMDGLAEPVPIARETGYEGEVRHLLRALHARADQPDVETKLDARVEQAIDLMAMVAAERDSLESGKRIAL